MEKQTITWHKYPEEKPKEDALYLVTVKTAYADSIQWLNGEWYGYAERDVIAWAEMPKPYTEGEKDGMSFEEAIDKYNEIIEKISGMNDLLSRINDLYEKLDSEEA